MIEHLEIIRGVGYDSNIYILDEEIMVDTGTGDNFSKIKKLVENKFDINKIKTILNTHCHYDHVGGNILFKKWLGAKLLVHEKDSYAIEHNTEATASWLFRKPLDPVSVEKKFIGGEIIKTKNLSLEILHTPGHTAGSICIYEKKIGFLITGDVLFENTCGRTDLPTGNTEQMIQTLKMLKELNPNYIFPGHGNHKSGKISELIEEVLENSFI